MEITEQYLFECQFLLVSKEGENPVYLNAALGCMLVKDSGFYIPYVGLNVLLRDISQLTSCEKISEIAQLKALIDWIKQGFKS